MSTGTPFIVIELTGPWPNLRFHTAQVILACILSWVSDLQIQDVEHSAENITLVYCGYKSAIVSIIRDLQKPGIAPALEELGINVDLRTLPSKTILEETASITCTPKTTVDGSVHVQTTELEIPAEEVDHHNEDEEQVQKKLMALEAKQDEAQPTGEGSYWESKSSQLVTRLTADEVYQILLSNTRPNTEAVQQEFFEQMETRQSRIGFHPKVKPQSVDEKELEEVKEESSLKAKDLEAQLRTRDDTIAQLTTALSVLTNTLMEREEENKMQLTSLQEGMESLRSKLEQHNEVHKPSGQATVPPEINHSDRDTKTTLSSEGSVVVPEEETYRADNLDVTQRSSDLVEFVVGFDKKPHFEHLS